MTTQRELIRHLAMVLAKQTFQDQATFGRAVEEYLSEHKTLGQASDRLVRWTTPGTWTRFLGRCWASYRERSAHACAASGTVPGAGDRP